MTAIVVGRFQVPYLHLGHIHLITTALQKCDEVVILLGCQINTDERNPYSILHRRQVIHRLFPHIRILHIWDRDSDEEWSKIIDKEADNFFHPVLYASRDSFASHYKGTLPIVTVPEIEGYSGTKLRNESGR